MRLREALDFSELIDQDGERDDFDVHRDGGGLRGPVHRGGVVSGDAAAQAGRSRKGVQR